jgi:hypothetical protein
MPTKKQSGRKSKDHLETLKITLTPVKGKGKTKSKTYRAEKFDFGKVVECINELLTK